MSKRPHILITNDDGVHAPGLRYLYEALIDNADVTIVAPAKEQSGVGLSITWRDPLEVLPVKGFEKSDAWMVTGTPGDCVKMAMSVVLDNPPDLIVAGINPGSNAGSNILYSGTVGSVIEGTMKGIPGIAISCIDYRTPNFETAKRCIPSVVEHMLSHPLPTGTFLNVNIPATDEVKGFRLTRQGRSHWMENPDKRHHPEGKEYYWLGVQKRALQEEAQSDIALLEQGYLTAVPIHIGEMTDHDHLSEKMEHFNNIQL